MMKISAEVQKAYELAKAAREKAHAPYSQFQVGAALKLKNKDEYIIGCNVENASFGATICAERTAILSSVAKYGKQSFEYIVVVTKTSPAIGPCGLCLQTFAEFCEPDFLVYFANLQGIERVVAFKDLLFSPFGEIPAQNE